jgi:hypothetical protein
VHALLLWFFALVGAERAAPVPIAGKPQCAPIAVGSRTYAIWRDAANEILIAVDDIPSRVIASSPSRGFANLPAVASNGRELFVVWNDVHEIRAVHASLDGIAQSHVITIARAAKLPLFAPAVRWTGRDYEVFWLSQPAETLYDVPPPPFELHSAIVRGSRVRSRAMVTPSAFYPQRVAFAGARLLWIDYSVPFFGPWGTPDVIPPSKLMMRTAERVIFEELYTSEIPQPALDLSVAPHGDGFIAFWTKSSKLRALVLDRDLNMVGEPVEIGDAIEGTARVVPGGRPFVVYERLVDGVAQTFIRDVQ